MKLLTKNGYKYAVGMFWQIPDKGKKTINLSKLVKDTGHNMYCQIGKHDETQKSFKLTYGFCNKDGLQGEKKVSSLGKFIVDASNLTAEYANSIICYKFKDAGEIDESGKALVEDLFGYIVLLNGTICPNEGEYVAPFESIRQSVIDKANQHNITTLYLPSDISPKFMNIFERLENAIYDDDLLLFIVHSASAAELKELDNFNEDNHSGKSINLTNLSPVQISELKQIIRLESFHDKIKDTVAIDKNIRYLIPNIVQIPLSSDEIYWKNSKFKQSYNKSLIKSIFSQTSKKYKIAIAILIMGLIGYLFYDLVTGKNLPLVQPHKPKPIIPKAIALPAGQFINLCLGMGDKFFRDLNNWTFSGLKCNSLGATFMFTSDRDTTLNSFTALIGESSGVTYQAKNGVYNQKFGIVRPALQTINLTTTQIMNNLQQAAIDYQFKLSIPTSKNFKKNAVTKYVINSKVSPVFLLNRGVLIGTKINDISMLFDKNSGIYNWTIQGEFK